MKKIIHLFLIIATMIHSLSNGMFSTAGRTTSRVAVPVSRQVPIKRQVTQPSKTFAQRYMPAILYKWWSSLGPSPKTAITRESSMNVKSGQPYIQKSRMHTSIAPQTLQRPSLMETVKAWFVKPGPTNQEQVEPLLNTAEPVRLRPNIISPSSESNVEKQERREKLSKLFRKTGTIIVPGKTEELDNVYVFDSNDLKEAMSLLPRNKEDLNVEIIDVSSTPLAFDPKTGTPFRDLQEGNALTRFTLFDQAMTAALLGDLPTDDNTSIQDHTMSMSDRSLNLLTFAGKIKQAGGRPNEERLPIYAGAINNLWKTYRSILSKALENDLMQVPQNEHDMYEIEKIREVLKSACILLKDRLAVVSLLETIDLLEQLKEEDKQRALNIAQKGSFTYNQEEEKIITEIQAAAEKQASSRYISKNQQRRRQQIGDQHAYEALILHTEIPDVPALNYNELKLLRQLKSESLQRYNDFIADVVNLKTNLALIAEAKELESKKEIIPQDVSE